MKNQGISLISLIITIIVIIILAAIVIFTGLGTPDSANFAHFCQDCDNVYSQVLNKYSSLKVKHATNNETRTDEQIYAEIAIGDNGTVVDQYACMDASNTSDTIKTESGELQVTTTHCQRIVPGASGSGLSLPLVRETNEAWYVTENGQVFNATGYVYDGNTYFNANVRKTGAELGVATKDTEEAKQRTRAAGIATVIVGGGTSYTGS